MTDSDRASHRRDLLRDSLRAIDQLQARLDASERARHEPIAIVGLGCRYPGASDPDAYWALLSEGRDAVREVPADRWDVNAGSDSGSPADARTTPRYGGFLDRVDEFDARFFGIAPREAATLDPQQRLLLEVAWETLEDAGIPPDSLVGSATGVFVGITTSDYARHLDLGSSAGSDVYAATGNALNAAAGRISFVLGLQGPCLAIDTACSSSLVAVHEACQALRAGECDLALAGGVNVMLSPVASILFEKWGMLAPDGRCKAFDANADGFVRGEGCGMVALRRLSDAEARGETVLAVIRGSAVNSDGRSSGLTVPNGLAQQKVIRRALAMAEAAPDDLDYVEAHGTGTPLGDPIEVEAIAAVLGAHRPVGRPLLLGTVKANIGHTESASGVAGLLKVVLAMRAGVLPRQLHFSTPNPRIEWGSGTLQVVAEQTPWTRSERPRLAGVSSFGFSGTNAHVVVGEASLVARMSVAIDRPVHLLVLSARTPTALRRVVAEVRDRLRENPASFADVCFSLATGRARHAERLALVASTGDAAVAELTRYLEGEPNGVQTGHADASRMSRQAWLFTGQGSQWAGMGRDLYDTLPPFRNALDQCAAIVDRQREHSLLSVMFGDDNSAAGLLDETRWTQPALFALEYALATTLRAWGLQPTAVAGHSLGEYVAACIAGVLPLEDALTLVVTRAGLMQALPHGGAMVALDVTEHSAQQMPEIADGSLSIAAVNGNERVVLSGPAEIVHQVATRSEQAGIRVNRLQVSHAFHSALIEPALAPFAAALHGLPFREPTIPVMTNLTGRPAARGELASANYWLRQLREPVRFGEAVHSLADASCDTFVEIGPHPVLVSLGRDALGEGASRAWLPTVRRGKPAWPQLLETLATLFVRGQDIDFRAYDAPHARTRVPVPRNGFDRERHWVDAARTPRSATHANANAPVHPLLGARIPSPLAGRQFSAVLDEVTPAFVADHVIFGHTLLPGTAFVEIGLAAAQAVGSGMPLVLEQLEIGAPLTLASARQLHVHVTAGVGTTRSAVRIASAGTDADDDAEWQQHATMTLGRGESSPVVQVRSAKEAAASCTTHTNVDDFYDRLSRAGLGFGPAFRGLRDLSVGPHEALGRIQTPVSIHDDAAQWLLHPALLDACFHVIGARLAAETAIAETDAIYLPIGIERVTLVRAAPSELQCVAVLRASDERSTELKVADLRLETMGGELVALIEGLRLRRVTREVLQRAIGGTDMRQFVSAVRWLPITREVHALARVFGRVVILPDTNGVAAALEVALTIAGTECVVLSDTAAQGDARALLDVLRASPTAWVIDCRNANSGGADWIDDGRTRYTQTLQVGQLLLEHPTTGFAVITRGAVATSSLELPDLALAPLLGLTRTIAMERDGAPALRLDLERTTRDATDAIVAALALAAETPELAWRNGRLLAPRLTPIDLAANVEVAQRRLLVIRERGVLDRLQIDTVPRQKPASNEVEIEVRAAGLNFRDVLNVLDRYPGAGALGSECSGVVTAVGNDVTDIAVGDDVVAFATDSFSTHAVAAASLTVRKPSGISYEEAASVPNAYVTAAFALRVVGKIQPGQRVLVHAALGGVGLAALRLARAAGATVIATAGSPEKRARALAEGATHAFDSRSTSFADDVLRVTHGHGVDIVVNSLAGDFVEAGMRVVSPGGCFVELGKNGIWTTEEATARMPSVRYVVVDIGEEIQRDVQFVRELFAGLVGEVASGSLRSLPIEAFALDDAVNAFRHMAMARHIGKVVLTPRPSVAPGEFTVRGDSTYLVTGGLSGLGLAVADWLAVRGARSLVLIGRRTHTTESAAALLRLRASGVHVTDRSLDVADRAAVEQLWRDVLPTLPPLRGIVHAAGTTADAALAAQDVEHFDRVAAAKIRGTDNLHHASLTNTLDFFVLFSSSSALLGSPGQAPYAAANAFLDGFAGWRRAQGHVATSYGWGAWGQTGMATAVPSATRRRWAERGIGLLDTAAALQAMAGTTHGADASVQIFAMDRARVVSHATPALRVLLGASTVLQESANVSTQRALVDDLRAANAADRAPLLRAHIRAQVSAVLGLEAGTEPEDGEGLSQLGMDSLMATELRTRLQRSLSHPLPSTLAFEHPTIGALTAFLMRELGLQPAAAIETPTTADKLHDVSDNEIARLLDAELDAAGF